MNYLIILLEGQAGPNIDALAANGRLGMVEGWGGLESLCGQSEDNGICFTCGLASLDNDGNVAGFVTDQSGIEELAEAMNSAEIDGVKFRAESRGDGIILTLEGEGLSSRIIPNPCSPGTPLVQVGAAASGTGRVGGRPSAKRTASVLNKLTYRLGKSFPGRTLFVRMAGSRKPLPEGVEVLELKDDIGGDILSKIKNSSDIVTIVIQSAGGSESVPVLIHGGGLIGNGAAKFSGAACSRGFRMPAGELLPWVLRATR